MAEKKKHQKSLIVYFTLVVVFVYLAISMIQIFAKIDNVNEEIAAVQQAYDQQVAQNEQLNSYLNSGKIDEYVEKVARDELGYVKPGEHIYYDVSVGD